MTEWHFVGWLDLLDHWQTLESGVVALIAAIIAVWLTNRNERRQAHAEAKAELLKEISATNTAILIAATICNTVVTMKKQLVKPLKDRFDVDREATLGIFAMIERGQKAKLEFLADFQGLPLVLFPTSVLQDYIFEKTTIEGRSTALFFTFASAADSLNGSILKRNELIEVFKGSGMEGRDLMNKYFGFRSPDGHVDVEYKSHLEAISLQTDDVIFFSRTLIGDLRNHGTQLIEKYRKTYGKGGPSLRNPDFAQVEAQSLMPDEKQYQSWIDGFYNSDSPYKN